MKKIKIILIAATILFLASCEDFKDINTDPGAVPQVDPVTLFYQVESSVESAGSSWNDSYAAKLRWMQYCTGVWGYSLTNFTYFSGSLGRSLYDDYNKAGSYAGHIKYYVTNELKEPEKYVHLMQASNIIVIYKGMHATDWWGSLVYSEGWQLRSGGTIEKPVYQTQKELYEIWDNELKEAIAKIKSATNQVSFKDYDMAYQGDMTKWVKAANALRLRIALRIWKREPAKAMAIANEVLAGDIFQNNEDGFIFMFEKKFTDQSTGDWHSVIDMDRASATFMNYLKKYNDPRKRIFFQINNLTTDNVAKYNSEQTDISKLLPASLTRWEGGLISYDTRTSDVRYVAKSTKDGIDMRPANRPQTRLWKSGQDNGAGNNWYPVVTYADFCFMASEFVLAGAQSTKTAEQWYTEGVTSSLTQWSKIGKIAQINGYEEITANEIDDFITQPDIKWNLSKAKEQIYTQSWVEHFKNNNESWAMWRRTGYPNQNGTIVTFEKIMISNIERTIPRRTRFSDANLGSSNYENITKAREEMNKDPEFGGLGNEFGRLWWDKK